MFSELRNCSDGPKRYVLRYEKVLVALNIFLEIWKGSGDHQNRRAKKRHLGVTGISCDLKGPETENYFWKVRKFPKGSERF